MKDDICENTIIHKDIVSKIKKEMPTDDFIIDLAELFKVFWLNYVF